MTHMHYHVQFRPWGSHARFETRSFATKAERSQFIREQQGAFECIPEDWKDGNAPAAPIEPAE